MEEITQTDFETFINKYYKYNSIKYAKSVLNSLNGIFIYGGNPKELPIPNDFYIDYDLYKLIKTVLVWDKFIIEVYEDETVIFKYINSNDNWEYKTKYQNILHHNKTQSIIYDHLKEFTIKSNS